MGLIREGISNIRPELDGIIDILIISLSFWQKETKKCEKISICGPETSLSWTPLG